MFRLLQPPKDPRFPTNLEGLGLFINEADQIRQKQDPNRTFQFYMNKNERYREMNRAAFDTAVKEIFNERLAKCGLRIQKLPLDLPADGRHVPIWISSNLSTCSRVILVFNDDRQDLGVWAWRVIGGKDAGHSINSGSMVAMLEYLQSKATGDEETNSTLHAPGLIIANPSELFWWRGGARAVTRRNWEAIPRRDALTASPRIDPAKNMIPGHETAEDHISYIFETLLQRLVSKDARLQIIAVGLSTQVTARWLGEHWKSVKSRLSGIVWLAPTHSEEHLEDFPSVKTYLKTNSCAYVSTPYIALGSSVPPEDFHGVDFGSDTLSGATDIDECIMPKAMTRVIDYLDEMYQASTAAPVESSDTSTPQA